MSDEENTKSKHINIYMKEVDDSRRVVHCKIKRETKLKKLKDLFCEQCKIPLSELVFVYNYARVRDKKTAEFMQEGDVIKVCRKSKLIRIRVINSHGDVIRFGIFRKSKLKKMMDLYCCEYEIPRSEVHFLYNGSRITDEATPESLDMQELDTIECHTAQEG